MFRFRMSLCLALALLVLPCVAPVRIAEAQCNRGCHEYYVFILKDAGQGLGVCYGNTKADKKWCDPGTYITTIGRQIYKNAPANELKCVLIEKESYQIYEYRCFQTCLPTEMPQFALTPNKEAPINKGFVDYGECKPGGS